MSSDETMRLMEFARFRFGCLSLQNHGHNMEELIIGQREDTVKTVVGGADDVYYD